ncbi:MAG: hypothetical protein MJY78_08235 [Fibrobacter sp.]|nr:hypothetical protein [Fibrobacter sp.]
MKQWKKTLVLGIFFLFAASPIYSADEASGDATAQTSPAVEESAPVVEEAIAPAPVESAPVVADAKKDSVNLDAPIALDTAKTVNVNQEPVAANKKSKFKPFYKALIISGGLVVVGGTMALVFDMLAKDATSGKPATAKEYKDGLDDAGQYQTLRDIGWGVLFSGVAGLGFSFCF